MSLMERMRDATDLAAMTLGEKIFGSIQVAALGVVVVFFVLFLLFLVITLMEKVLYKDEKKQMSTTKAPAAVKVEEEEVEEDIVDDTELVAVITAAVAASLHTSTHNIVVRNIVRTPDTAPAWNKLGRMQQINRG